MYIPALSCLISATSEIFCVQLEDTFGEKRWNLSFSLRGFLQASVGQKGREWEYCIWRMLGIRQTALDATRTEQGSLVLLSFDTDSRFSLEEPHPPAQGSQDCSRVTAATWDVNHLWAMSCQGFMHRQIIFCLPPFLIMTALHLLSFCLWRGEGPSP